MERLRFNICTVLLVAFASACSTTQQIVEDSAKLLNLNSSSQIVIGEKVSYPAPLPDYYPIFREKFPNEIIAKGWDMDKDGRIDKIDVLGLDGEIIEQFFDFDRDGQIDLKESFGAEKQTFEKTL